MTTARNVAAQMSAKRPMMNDRRKLLAALVGAVALSAVGGWVVGSRISSPAELAARTAAPLASPILVPAEERILSTDIVTRGTARFGSPQQLSLASSTLKTTSGVVARLPSAGTELHEGDVAFTTSGRPVFLLVGRQPAYRDLGPGSKGEDVRQLEEALGRLGFDSGAADGVYDARTEHAVAAWYERAGFSPFTASAEQLAAVRVLQRDRSSTQLDAIAAQGSVSTAEAAVEAAYGAYARALVAVERSTLAVDGAAARAKAADEVAAREVATKQALLDALIGRVPVIPATSAEIAAGEANVVAAQTNATLIRIMGEKAVADAVATGTPADVAAAQAQADAANRAADAETAAKQAALAALRAGTPGTPATTAEIATVRGDLATARANAKAIGLAGERDNADAQGAVATARRDATSSLADVHAAESALEHAEAALSVRSTQADLAAGDFEVASLKAGVQVPADEVIFVASAPVRVADKVATSGDQTTGVRLTVTNAVVAVDGSLRLEEAPLVKLGMRVLIDEPALGIKAAGSVSRVAESPGSNGVDGFHVYFEVLVEGSPPSLVGASVRMTVPIESTSGGVLAVPISALTLSADGSSRVQRQKNGALEFVTVQPGLSASGFVAVTPVSGTLEPGDLVVIGFDPQGTTPK